MESDTGCCDWSGAGCSPCSLLTAKSACALTNSHNTYPHLDPAIFCTRTTGTTPLRQSLASAVSRLSSLESQLSALDSLGDDDTRTALQRRIDIIDRAGLSPGEWRVGVHVWRAWNGCERCG